MKPPTLLGMPSTDGEILLWEITKRQRSYSELKAMLGGDRDRAIAAIDALLAAGKVERVIVAQATHYRAVP